MCDCELNDTAPNSIQRLKLYAKLESALIKEDEANSATFLN